MPTVLIYDISSASIASKFPYFDLLYVGKYTSYEFSLDGVSDVVPVHNIYKSLYPLNPIVRRKEICTTLFHTLLKSTEAT